MWIRQRCDFRTADEEDIHKKVETVDTDTHENAGLEQSGRLAPTEAADSLAARPLPSQRDIRSTRSAAATSCISAAPTGIQAVLPPPLHAAALAEYRRWMPLGCRIQAMPPARLHMDTVSSGSGAVYRRSRPQTTG